MHQICYMSRATTFDEAVVRDIVAAAQERNAADDITGLLLSDGARYLQAIEGAEGPLRACYDRICRDPRHHDIVTVSDHGIDRRQFGHWAMLRRHREWLAGSRDFRHAVMNDVAAVTDAPLKAMFIGFAALSR